MLLSESSQTLNTVTWQTYVPIIKDIITALAALTAGIVAVVGLQSWRRQLKGKTDYELARRFLRAAYRVREAIRYVRNPIRGGSEYEEANQKPAISNSQRSERANAEAALYSHRWNRLHEAISDLQLELLEAEVSWGSKPRQSVDPLYKCIGKLRASTWLYLHDFENPNLRTDDKAEARRKQNDLVVFESSEDPSEDQFTAEIKDAIEVIETFMKRYLK
jgi:hypothetical protein